MRYRFPLLLYISLSLFLVTACTYRPQLPSEGAYLVDSGGRNIATLNVGGSLEAGARGLVPGQAYNFELTLDGETVSFARLTANMQGEIAPFHLWFHSGVVGCSLREKQPDQLPQFMFLNFDEAQRALDGRSLALIIRPSKQHSSDMSMSSSTSLGTATALIDDQQAVMQVGQKLEIPVRVRRSPMVYPSTESGCLLNSAEANTQSMYVSGRHFKPGEFVEVRVAPNQRLWRVGDIANDVTGVSGAAAPARVQADANGRFTVKVWDRELQRRGAYDIITRRNLKEDSRRPWINEDDIISYGSDTAYLLFLRYPPGGPLMDIAGRKLNGFPYFEFADSFAETGDDVWGAVDPTYVPETHPGGRYAAYYVVDHRNVTQWDTNTTLPNPDESGAIEIMPVKAGCINATDIVIWSGTKPIGNYDVVVNFGSTQAETETAFMDDFSYDSTLDFLDGADQIGFRVAKDPYVRGTIPIGEAEYSFDDSVWVGDRVTAFIGASTGEQTIDLRAVVRYPATTAGTNTTVRTGQHPVFIIEHGNHSFCNVSVTSHSACPVASRELNHRGYDELLNILASHGVVAVSIDAYDLTGGYIDSAFPTQPDGTARVPQWIEERGDLILKHLEFWSHLNDPSTYTSYSDPFSNRFLNHVDMTNISVSGHSRGGEASVAAYMRNLSRPVAQQFSINSVSSIAPVDALAGPAYTLGDVPYFVILPAADCDVSSLHGARIYDRAGGASDQTVKSGNHIYGANHNFFNTVWAADGDECGTSSRIDFIPAADQQRIGESYLAAFGRSQLLSEDVYEDMFRGRLTFPSTAGYKIYPFRHEKNHMKLDAGTGAGTPDVSVTESLISGPSVHTTQAVQLNWSASNARYTYSFSPGKDAAAYEVLAFRAAQTNNPINPSTGQEFRVKLIGGGKERAVYTGRFDLIPPPYNRSGTDHNVMTAVRIPLHSFILNNSDVTLNNIDTVEFIFSNPNQGEIYIDDIEFSR